MFVVTVTQIVCRVISTPMGGSMKHLWPLAAKFYPLRLFFCSQALISTAGGRGGASGAAALVGVGLCCPSAPAPSRAEAPSLRGVICCFLFLFNASPLLFP